MTQPTYEASSNDRKPVYSYGRAIDSNEITLRFGDEPVMTEPGYLRLAGTVTGDEPRAVIEIGGKGEMFIIGGALGKYRLVSIDREEVKLCSKK